MALPRPGSRAIYRPPLAGAGEELDQIVLHRVATATVKSFVTQIAGLAAQAV